MVWVSPKLPKTINKTNEENMKEIIKVVKDLRIALTDKRAICRQKGGKTLTQDIIKDMTPKDLFSLQMKTETSNIRIAKAYNKLWAITNIRTVTDFNNLMKTLEE